MKPSDIALLYREKQGTLTAQARQVYSFMSSKGGITQADAARSRELAGVAGGAITARLSELRRAGFPIERTTKTDPVTGRRYSRYCFKTGE